LAFLQDLDGEAQPAVSINNGRCVRCLTCRRLCPHGAIDIDVRISVVTEACQSCGLCVAGCPARAIDMEGVPIDADIKRRLEPLQATADASQKSPSILVFGCARSAGQALAATLSTKDSLPAGVQFIEVPCGGTIASRHLLAAFETGADGVMLLTCHTGNCQSEIGNQVARKRADGVRELLTVAGLESDRLYISTLAANMGHELTFMIEAFVDRIDALNCDS
jgi:coenzyme F420-reducing hydrogenase delta subunit/NAD-dependent dihydropyrimidine dehydrogenase PreA subunit